MDLVVTTIHKPTPEVEEKARQLAAELGVPAAERGKNSLPAIQAEYNVNNVLVVTKDGPVVHTPDGEYFFHLSMAELRIKNIINGKHDHMAAALGLTPGTSVLDCTLGLATDAIVASYVVGSTGRVLGLEASPIIAAITGLGLSSFVSDQPHITAALRRVNVVNADYNDYLPTLPDASFDVVFFDPMFRIPINSSVSLKPLRGLADSRPLNEAALREARRVARKRVIIKEASGSREFSRLGIHLIQGGKYSSVHYGIIEVED